MCAYIQCMPMHSIVTMRNRASGAEIILGSVRGKTASRNGHDDGQEPAAITVHDLVHHCTTEGETMVALAGTRGLYFSVAEQE